MGSDRLAEIFRRDLDTLPGLQESELLPKERRDGVSRLSAILSLAAAAAVMLVIGISVDGVRSASQRLPSAASVNTIASPTAVAPSPRPATPAVTAAIGSLCAPGEVPVLDISMPPPPGDQPGRGAASPEAAFRRARPDVSHFTLTPTGISPSAPVWIAADNDTFVAVLLGTPGGDNWFAYPAKLLRCQVP